MKSNLATKKTKVFFRKSFLPFSIAALWVVAAPTLAEPYEPLLTPMP